MFKCLKNHLAIVGLLIIVILSIALSFYLYFKKVTEFFPDISDRGSFGDMFGGISAVFSALAFGGVIYSLILQRNELKSGFETQQKTEEMLRAQTKSLEKTARLNALNAVLQSLGSALLSVTIGIHPEPYKRDTINKEMEKIKQEILNEIEEK